MNFQELTQDLPQNIQQCSTDLEVMIDLIHDKYRKVFTDYKELARLISLEFKTQVHESDIWQYYEPEIQDKIIQMRTLNIQY